MSRGSSARIYLSAHFRYFSLDYYLSHTGSLFYFQFLHEKPQSEGKYRIVERNMLALSFYASDGHAFLDCA